MARNGRSVGGAGTAIIPLKEEDVCVVWLWRPSLPWWGCRQWP